MICMFKTIRGEICHPIHRYTKANDKYMKDKNKESSYLQYWNVNNLYRWAMSQKLSLSNLEWIEGTSHFNEHFIKNKIKKLRKFIFSKFMLNILKNYMTFTNDLPFYLKE